MSDNVGDLLEQRGNQWGDAIGTHVRIAKVWDGIANREECEEAGFVTVACTRNEVGAKVAYGIEARGLGETASDGDLRAGGEAPGGADQFARLGIGNVSDGAGVDDVGIGGRLKIHQLVPAGGQLLLYRLRLVLIHLSR